MAPSTKRGPGRPKKDATIISYCRLTEKEAAKVDKEAERTGKSKAAIIQNAVQRMFKLQETN